MKGPLSALPAAVLLALAGSAAEANSPAIRQSAHSNTPPARPASRHRTAPTGSILHDQTGGMTGEGFFANEMTSSYSSFTSRGADDFVVPTGQTWTVNGFVIPYVQTAASRLPASADVLVHNDDGSGHPGPTVLCDGTGTPGTATSAVFSFTLATPCVLQAGTYWLDFAFADIDLTDYTFWLANGPIAGQPAVWWNPGGRFGVTCSDAWHDFATCFTTVPSSVAGGDFAFQVIGNASSPTACSASSPTCLTVGMALDNGDPAECGTATSLSATAGDKINTCFTFTNNTAGSLDYHTLSDNLDGNLFTLLNQAVPGGGGTYQYNSIATANDTGTFAHTATWTAQDARQGYTVASNAGTSSNPDFIDISASGTALSLSDSASAGVTMPFSFVFYGESSNAICVNNNGFIAFDNTDSSCLNIFGNNFSLPTVEVTGPVLFPFWDDLASAGNVYVGAAPGGDPYVVQWQDKDVFNSTVSPPYTFEVQMWQDGTIRFAYEDLSGGSQHHNGLSATVGLQQDSSYANQYSYNSPVVPDYGTLAWTPVNPNVHAASASYTLNVGAPVLAPSPTALSGSAAPDASTTTTLGIGNTGNRDLIWSLAEAPAPAGNAHFPAHPAHWAPRRPAAGIHDGRVPRSPVLPGKPVPRAAQHVSHGRGVSAVPAFGQTFTLFGSAYVGLDAANPGTLQTIAASMTTSFFAGTFANNDFSTEYAISNPGNDLYAIDTATGAIEAVGPTGLDGNVSGMRWDASTGVAYAMAESCGTASSLYTIDLGTGATTLVGSSSGTCIIDIAIDPDGNLYGVDLMPYALVAIDKTTGATQPIGSLGFNAGYAEGLDFDPSTGTLYFAGYDTDTFLGGMYTIDLATGAATLIGPIGPDGDEMDAFAIAIPSTQCVNATDVPWLSEDVSGGTTAPGTTSPVTVTMDATGLSPGTYAGSLCIASNDLTQRNVSVPVTFTVTAAAADIVFENGFDP